MFMECQHGAGVFFNIKKLLLQPVAQAYWRVAHDAAGLVMTAGVFMWNLVSWDVLGVHPLSFAGDGSGYKSRRVSDMVAQHNRGVY